MTKSCQPVSPIPSEVLSQTLLQLWDDVREEIRPKEKISVSEWADQERFLSPEDSKKAILGDPKWSHEGFEYLKGFEDALSDPLVRKITVQKSAQTGFTQAMLNMLGYIVDREPGPVLVLYPTETNAEKFSKRKLDPMLRDTPALRGKVSEAAKKDGNNSTLEKGFPGGFISIVSAKSVNNLSMQSIMYLFIDELDRIERIAGNEGDTVEVASKRLQGFKEVSKEVKISTPTVRGGSRIEDEYSRSDRREFYLPCPVCGQFQTLKFGQLKGWRIDKGVYDASKTYYECEECHAHLGEQDKYKMLPKGEWRAAHPEIREHAGFLISELYSTLSSWNEIIEDFIKKKDNPVKLQTFVNLVLGETWEENEAEIPEGALRSRVEPYDGTVLPEGVYLLTAAADVQKDRVELGVKGWGKGEESWLIAYEVFYGDTQTLYAVHEGNLWYRVEKYLEKSFEHEHGIKLRISACAIDAGYATKSVQNFTKRMQRRGKSWIFPIQGDKGMEGAPLLNRGSVRSKVRIKQFIVGTATAKNIIFSRLHITEYGPGYMHFPKFCDEEYFLQLTAEKQKQVYEKGIPVRKRWEKIRTRNEALDIEVYNLAALEYLNVNLEAVGRDFERTRAARLKAIEQMVETEVEKLVAPEKAIKETEPGGGSGEKDLRSGLVRSSGGRKKIKRVGGSYVREW